MDDESYYNYRDGSTMYSATPIRVQTVGSSAPAPGEMDSGNSGSSGARRALFQRFSNGHSTTKPPQQQQQPSFPTPTPTPPTIRGTRNPRLNSEERGVRGAPTARPAPQETATAAAHPAPPPEAPATGAATAALGSRASTMPSPGVTTSVVVPGSARAATSETPSGVATPSNPVERPTQAAGTSTVSPATLTQLRTHLARSHGLAGQPIVIAAGSEASRTTPGASNGNTAAAKKAGQREQHLGDRPGGSTARSSDGREHTNNSAAPEQPKPRLPQLRPVVAANSATVERLSTSSANHSGGMSGTNNTSAADGGGSSVGVVYAHQSHLTATNVTRMSPSPGNGGVVSVLEPLRTDADDSFNPSLLESTVGLEDGDLAPEVAEACHSFLEHLPVDWARAVVRAITLQTATLQVPPRLLRAPAIFDSYAELRGEVSATLEAAAAGNNSTSQGGGSGSLVGKIEAQLPFLYTINLQQLLTVAPALLRHRLHNTRGVKLDELRAGFRGNAQTAARTEASVNRYAYLPHVQRDVHFGAVLAQGALRMMTPGPRLTDGTTPTHGKGCSNGGDNAADGARISPRQHTHHASSAQSQPASVATNTTTSTAAVATPTRTYTAVSFENFASIFLKDRFDIAQTERSGSGGASNSGRHGGRHRRRIDPFFEREFVATIATGQEEAALFASTLAPEFMVGLPSFLKHPERAVPLSVAAALHHLYTVLNIELFLRSYTAATLRNAAVAAEMNTGAAAATGRNANNDKSSSNVNSGRIHFVAGNPATVLSLIPSEAPPASSSLMAAAAAGSPVLRGPALEVGMLYVRNTIVCSASTPGMEAYLIFLHQIVYPNPQGLSGRRDGGGAAAATATSSPNPPPPPCRAVVQLSEDANGSMAAPPAPPSHTRRSPSSNANPTSRTNPSGNGDGTPGIFELPTIKHAAAEMTQLVTWVQDVRSHDARHGQPFSCHLTFVPTHIPALAAPTPSQLCAPLPHIEMEDANSFPCVAVLATVDLWKTLPPPAVSNLLRIFFMLDRHAQRVMELESPDYGTEEEEAAAAAAVATKTRNSADDNAAAKTNPVAHAIPFPDPQLRQHVASGIALQVRAYLERIPFIQRDTGKLQRLVSFFMARLHFYEDLNERHCKTEEELQQAELQRMARQRTHVADTPPPATLHSSASLSLSSTLPQADDDVYGVRRKDLGDALAVALAAEAVAASSDGTAAARHGGGDGGSARVGVAHDSSWLREPALPLRREENVTAAPSLVVLLVPQRDVQRR
ncbi:hypothetical protein ABB37_06902 [Leptomonas pyrrhocoris]|uniref:Uncharacterized protein n=1 Tax=Leptomonas pyrrhocoris TaxID=157538 RepID=A0A0M9FWQ5_LEPPY|nr:hypothetical protein ABB37_06902 [Leptomonas pyrrhocoris]KPA77519.1 hypothetical protein ABB37_06902 [Leptomonas pyrrhocoris]|eukprot:XP_015655958.1 hypothetical protein ABB37_06902 [Leptomonas pyrrhocoris]